MAFCDVQRQITSNDGQNFGIYRNLLNRSCWTYDGMKCRQKAANVVPSLSGANTFFNHTLDGVDTTMSFGSELSGGDGVSLGRRRKR